MTELSGNLSTAPFYVSIMIYSACKKLANKGVWVGTGSGWQGTQYKATVGMINDLLYMPDGTGLNTTINKHYFKHHCYFRMLHTLHFLYLKQHGAWRQWQKTFDKYDKVQLILHGNCKLMMAVRYLFWNKVILDFLQKKMREL